MIKKVDLGISSAHGVFGNPAPLGLFGLAISCGALTPIAFGVGLNQKGFITAAVFAIFFGGFCQLFTGLMDFANKNTYGGTIFTAFAFNWFITGGAMIAGAFGFVPEHSVIVATEIVMFIVFIFLTYGFGFFSKLLFLFLLDIDLLYVCKIAKAFLHVEYFDIPIAIFTLALGIIGLWLTLAGLMNPIIGKALFPVGGPMFFSKRSGGFDWTARRVIFDVLYKAWKVDAFKEMSFENIKKVIHDTHPELNFIPDIFYLYEYGAIKLTCDEKDSNKILSARLTSSGIDLYEQLVLRKYDF